MMKKLVTIILDISLLEKEQDEPVKKTQLFSKIIKATIRENSAVALDKIKYQKAL